MIWFPIGIVFVLGLWFAAGRAYDSLCVHDDERCM